MVTGIIYKKMSLCVKTHVYIYNSTITNSTFVYFINIEVWYKIHVMNSKHEHIGFIQIHVDINTILYNYRLL